MQAVYTILGIAPPVLLANKDNAAAITLGDEGDSAAIERAIKVSQRGGHKLVSLCGDLFRHKDDKRGHQDLHRHHFSMVKFEATGTNSTIKFPDTSNNRYNTHLGGAVELVTINLKRHAVHGQLYKSYPPKLPKLHRNFEGNNQLVVLVRWNAAVPSPQSGFGSTGAPPVPPFPHLDDSGTWLGFNTVAQVLSKFWPPPVADAES
ncbi:hypothetical protein B0H14DRAFT_3448402 [Mycena olivaceomarginata]|nr:hypothetical protein B0H14DRAFT_3448402 [Mycena olivaceomarginata]